MASTDHKYRIKYEFTPEYGEFSGEEVKRANRGGCDAIIFHSILYPEDGTFSCKTFSIDGRKGGDDLSAIELFKVWMLLGSQLAESEELDQARRYMARMPLEAMREAMGIKP
jgi:hypothetical protein